MKSKRKNIFKRVISIMLVFSLNFALGISGRSIESWAAATDAGTIGEVRDYDNQDNGNVIIFDNTDGTQVKVELCTDRTVRVQLSLDGENGYRPEDSQYYMVQKNDWAPVEKTIEDKDTYYSIKTNKMEIRVEKNSLKVGMYDLAGNLLSRDADDGMYWNADGTRGVKKEEGTENAGGIFGFGSGDHGRRANLNRYNQDFKEFSMSHGRVVAPFFMSTVGYGIFLNTIEKDTIFFRQGGGFQTKNYLDYFFMYGPDFKTILNEYAEITGRMELYGKWAHGFMLSKYGNDNATQAEFLEWIHKLRDDGYPTDCYVFDFGWRGDIADNGGKQTGAGEKFGKQMWSNDKTKFPDIDAMFKEADELGFRVGLHNNAGTPEACGGKELYKPENEAKWVKSYMDSVITTGYGDWFWPDEFDVLGSNTAPTFSSKGAYEAWQEYTDESRPMFVTRGSYAGQHFGTAWSGDINPTSAELLNQVGFSIDTGLIGYWTTSHDLGGFMSRPSNELYTRWVSEFGAWNGIMRTHGHDGREPWTFDQTAQDTLKQNLKIRYALYPYTYSLAWQGYSQGVPMMRAMLLEDGSQSNPDAWDINKQYYYGDWFLVAPAGAATDTVVSVWLPPQTVWYNYYTGERYAGGENGKTINVAANLDEIPVFVKAGAIVPMGPDVNYADEKPLDPLTIDIYPEGKTSFTLYEDDGLSRKYITENAYSTTTFECDDQNTTVHFKVNERMNGNAAVYAPVNRSYNLKFNHMESVGSVKVNSNIVDRVNTIEAYNDAAEAYWLDQQTDTVYVKTKDTGAEIQVVLSDVVQKEPEDGNEDEGLPPQKIHDGDIYELENGTFIGGVSIDTEWKGYTGTGFAKGFKNVGDGVEFKVDIQKAGSYNLALNVNCGKKNDSKYDANPREGTMYLDGDKLRAMKFEVTPTWGDSKKNGDWRKYSIENIELSAGIHTFKFLAEGNTNPGNYNLDSLTFNRIDTSIDAFEKIGAGKVKGQQDVTIVEDTEAQMGQKAVIKSGGWMEFPEVRGENKGYVELRVKSNSADGQIIVYENGIGDKTLATLELPKDGNWTVLKVPCKDTDAVESGIFLKFTGECEFDWLKFYHSLPKIYPGARFELEDGEGVTDNGKLRIDKEHAGYSGTGYVAGWKQVGNYVQFTAEVTDSGIYDFVIRAGCGKKNGAQWDNSPRTGAIYVNDQKVKDFSVPVVDSWKQWNEITVNDIYLGAGQVTIKFRAEGEVNPGNFNLDRVSFEALEADKADLEALIAYAQGQKDSEKYGFLVPAVKIAFETALDAAKAVNEKVTTQAEVDKAYDRLLQMVQMLDFTGNNTALKEMVLQAEGLNEKIYTADSWAVLNDALTKAQGVLKDENALQAEIDAAAEALKAAIDGLEIISVDKTKLEKLVDKAGKYDLTEYTETTGKILTGACEEAKKVLGNKEATQEQIDNAYADLQKAIFGLRLIPDKGQLEGLIKNAQAVDIANYTVKSATAFAAALDTAMAVFADGDATEAEVKAAEKALEEAQKNLVAKADAAEKVESKDDSKATNKVVSDDGSKKEVSKAAAKTGDATSALPAALAGAVALAVLMVFKKRR